MDQPAPVAFADGPFDDAAKYHRFVVRVGDDVSLPYTLGLDVFRVAFKLAELNVGLLLVPSEPDQDCR